MKKFISGVFVGIILGAAAFAVSQDEGFYSGKVAFVKVAQENLRNAPGGDVLGTLAKGAPMQVLEAQDKWLRVAAVGYIWKESVTGETGIFKGEPYRAAMILVNTDAEAQAVLKELQGGADFAEVAKQKSKSPTAKKGGDLGNAYPGDFAPEFEKAILALKVGGISGIVKTTYGFHIFKRLK